MSPAEAICVALLAAIVAYLLWRLGREESDLPEREPATDYDLAGGEWMRYRERRHG